MAVVVEYLPGQSPIHKLHPISKMAWALTVLGLCLLTTNYVFMALVFAAVLAVGATAKVLPRLAGMLKGLTIFACCLFVIQLVFYNEGNLLFYLLPLGKGYLRITTTGVYLGLAVALRMLAIVSSFLIVLATTRTQDIMTALVEKLRIPNDIAFMALIAIRFIPTFLQELRQISDAQKARAFVMEGWNPIKKIKAYLPLAVPLVLLSLQKAQQLVLAMETRGYGMGPRSHLRELHFRRWDGLAFILLILAMGGGILLKAQGFLA